MIWAQNLEERKGHLLIFCNRGCSVFWGNALFWNIGHIWGQRRRTGAVSQRLWFQFDLERSRVQARQREQYVQRLKGKMPISGTGVSFDMIKV